ncbi:AAA family ATPase [Formosa undariae]|uniref:AAA family ATPase n=1 Tax=Formosa undariae TaxID=1325436 RepID=A0ABV5EZC8_9FLAO
MIEKLKIHKTASYSNLVEIEPKEINYFYGSNGVGKSSLSNVIADEDLFPDCSLTWKTTPIETLVYNKSFVKTSFNQSNAIKGVFTLGKDATNAQEFITKAKDKVDALKIAIDGLKKTSSIKEDVLKKKTEETVNKAWSIKVKYESNFKPAFIGFIKSGENFFKKCLLEINNTSTLLTESEIKIKSDKVFSDNLMTYDEIQELDFKELNNYENSYILKTKIIGKEDIEIGKLIHKLDNSDWVKDGVDYMQQTINECPFCQQSINQELRKKIESFFDESYNEQKQELDDFIQSYKIYIANLITKAKSISELEISILDFSILIDKINILEVQFKNNINKLLSKKKTPSLIIELESLEAILKEVSGLVLRFKKEIEENNKTIKNITIEKEKLKSEIWRFVINELEVDLNSYVKRKTEIDKAIQAISKSENEKNTKKLDLEKQIKDKESLATDVIHTVNEINKILNLFGFTNFKLDVTETKGFYKIIREDGSEVKETLSEGEYTFITFLYFYHLIRGSINESGISKDKIVVIDDPISSLDSNILFIVSNLIKTLVKDTRNDTNGIKQIFILTHNVYFFKEVTLKVRDGKWKEESYWIIRKLDNKTQINEHQDNPIKTTYELLWRELDNLENVNTATIFNTLRRILEYYFNILGGLKYEEAINQFEGEEQIICKALISWINDGSHFINDDLVVYVEPESVEKYIKVFKLIFEKMGHKSHFDMMSRSQTEFANA